MDKICIFSFLLLLAVLAIVIVEMDKICGFIVLPLIAVLAIAIIVLCLGNDIAIIACAAIAIVLVICTTILIAKRMTWQSEKEREDERWEKFCELWEREISVRKCELDYKEDKLIAQKKTIGHQTVTSQEPPSGTS